MHLLMPLFHVNNIIHILKLFGEILLLNYCFFLDTVRESVVNFPKNIYFKTFLILFFLFVIIISGDEIIV